MENTVGHLAGFFYMVLLLRQGSLFLTRMHINRLNEIIRIPLIEYMLVFGFIGIRRDGWEDMGVAGCFRKQAKPLELISERKD
jgi:hypothetical protein